MPTFRRVFVVGAGASKEVRLPLGEELCVKIANLLNFQIKNGSILESRDGEIIEAFRLKARREDGNRGDINPYLQAARRIRDGMPQAASIDNYLDVHSDDEFITYCGKLAIVRTILEAERYSLLWFNSQSGSDALNFKKLQNTWFRRLWYVLVENCKVENFGARLRQLAFIVFNYDRCIEHFLYCSLQNYYSIPPDRAAEILNNLNIYHPYGKVGNLPWQSSAESIEFGGDIHQQKLNELTSKIKTFTEGMDPSSSEIVDIRRSMAESESIIFLGFAFHSSNLQLLFSETDQLPGIREIDIYGTGMGLSLTDCENITTELAVKFVPTKLPKISHNLSCCQLFDEFRRGVTLVS